MLNEHGAGPVAVFLGEAGRAGRLGGSALLSCFFLRSTSSTQKVLGARVRAWLHATGFLGRDPL